MLGTVLATLAVLFWFGAKYKIFQPVVSSRTTQTDFQMTFFYFKFGIKKIIMFDYLTVQDFIVIDIIT